LLLAALPERRLPEGRPIAGYSGGRVREIGGGFIQGRLVRVRLPVYAVLVTHAAVKPIKKWTKLIH
jgi:hypothetical protein